MFFYFQFTNSCHVTWEVNFVAKTAESALRIIAKYLGSPTARTLTLAFTAWNPKLWIQLMWFFPKVRPTLLRGHDQVSKNRNVAWERICSLTLRKNLISEEHHQLGHLQSLPNQHLMCSRYPMQMLLLSFQSCCRIEAEYVCDKQRKVSMVRNIRSPNKYRGARWNISQLSAESLTQGAERVPTSIERVVSARTLIRSSCDLPCC